MTQKLWEIATALPGANTPASIAQNSVADKVGILEIEDLAFQGFTCIACHNHYPGLESPTMQKARYFVHGCHHVKSHANARIESLLSTIERLQWEKKELLRKYRKLQGKEV